MSGTEQPGASFGIVKHGIAINITRDMAIDFGLIPMTTRERADREKAAAKWRLYAEAQKQADADMISALHAKTDPVTSAVVELHKPIDDDSTIQRCDGCDFEGYESEPPEWPCRTVIAVAKAHGIPTREDVPR